MSLQLNNVTIAGALGQDPEVKYTNSGTAYANISVATSRRYKPKDGNEWKEETTWVDMTAWGRQAETLGEYLQKGSSIYVEGHLKLDQWEDKKTGAKRTKLKVIIDKWLFVESKKNSGGQGGGQGGGQRRESQQGSSRDDDRHRDDRRQSEPSRARQSSHGEFDDDDLF